MMHSRLALLALALGNFVIGVSILAPVGILAELASHLGVSIGTAGLLISGSAAVVCASPPFVAWMTSRVDRRALLSAVLLWVALGQTASALASSFPVLLAIQLAMLAFAGGFTPLASSAAALLVSEGKRAPAISSILVGWALAIAAGLPLVSLIASQIGWRETYALIGILAALGFVALLAGLPKGLQDKPINFATWGEVARSRDLVLLLSITCLVAISQYVVIAFAGPLLIQLTKATPERIAAVFALFGVMTLVGNIFASRVVRTWGAFKTSASFMACMVIGIALWAFGAGIYPSMATGAAIWGFGFSAVAAMQQVRLITAAPRLATASVAVNNTAIYLGQAIGAAIGGVLLAAGGLNAMGFVALALIAMAFGFLWLTRSIPDAPGPGSLGSPGEETGRAVRPR
jgi:predicted MFS family arabinose efflux permease